MLTATFHVPWHLRFPMTEALIHGPDGRPMAHPLRPDHRACMVRIVGVGRQFPTIGGLAYDEAEVNVTYALPDEVSIPCP